MAVKKLNRRTVEDMVSFIVRDPSLEGNPNAIREVSRRFKHVSDDEFSAAFTRVVAILRCYVQLDDAEAVDVRPKAEPMPMRRRRAPRGAQLELFTASMGTSRRRGAR
jgi:hypothetical protein